MFGWFRKNRSEASADALDIAQIAAQATEGMPAAEHIRARALPQLYELLDAEIAKAEAAQKRRFSEPKTEAMRAAFAQAVMGEARQGPKRAKTAPISRGVDHLGQIEGLVAQAFQAQRVEDRADALDIAAGARDAGMHYIETLGGDDPALKAALERAIAEQITAVLR